MVAREIAMARAALFDLQNRYQCGSADFQRVYRMRVELDQFAHCDKQRSLGKRCMHTAPTECTNNSAPDGADWSAPLATRGGDGGR
jgi:hypothetical protein